MLPRPRRSMGLPLAAILVVTVLGVPQRARPDPLAPRTERFGDLVFPRDEHVHHDGWDFWWGAADILTHSGNRYTVEIDPMFSVHGVGHSRNFLFAWQGPYRGRTVETEYGSASEPHGRFVRRMSSYVPGVSDLLRLETLEMGASAPGRVTGLWERTTLDDHAYHLLVDGGAGRIHPTGEAVQWRLEAEVAMRTPPLLAGGEGRWWYGVPQGFGYPSRSFQYMQAAHAISGSLELQQPDGSVLQETIDPVGSSLVMTHEYDASPEDLPIGLSLSLLNQAHPRYAQYYQGGMPWELLFVDLKNGAQLFVAVLVFEDAEPGTLQPVTGTNLPGFQVLATLRLPDGTSVPLDEGDGLTVEHLSYRTMIGKTPTFLLYVDGIWKQAWTYRVRYGGGEVSGKAVPAFDVGLVPRFGIDEPQMDPQGDAQRQRVPFVVSGAYDGCPVDGFAWSEIIVNWYRYEHDPWFVDGSLPGVPPECS